MKFCSLTSGSSGNCQYIETDNARILIDAGLSGKAIEKNLAEIGVDPSSLDAIFVTHEHMDHIQGVGVLARRYQLEVFANENTWLAMDSTVKRIDSSNRKVFENDQAFFYKDLAIYPMSIFHDCVQGTGYILEQKNKKISVLTDTGWVNTNMMDKMAGSNLYYLESNHDIEMLQTGPYPRVLKERISSNRGHLSNDHAAQVLGKLLQRKGEHVVLAHLSGENNLPLIAARTTRDHLAGKKIHEGIDFILEVAKPKLNSNIIEI